jgi:hypothetical protein
LGCVGSGKCTGRGLIPFLPVSSRTGDIPPTYARDTRFHASHRALLCWCFSVISDSETKIWYLTPFPARR